MTMKTKLVICLGALLGIAATVQQVGWPLAKLTIHVVGEQGEPIPDADVTISFREKLTDRNAWTAGKTDKAGNFTAEGHSDKRLSGSVRKTGYYEAGTGWIIFKDPILGKWQPWDTVAEAVLRPIGNPVALAARRVQGDIPGLEQPCGYDLEKGDWVVPHGKGMRPDLIFNVRRDYKDWSNFTVEAEVTFAQIHDGLVRMKAPAYARNSAFGWERSASETGYVAPHTIRFFSRHLKTHVDQEKSFEATKDREQGYFFRVRTVEENGRIVAANYGKITGDIGIDPRDSKTCLITFTYYFNPNSLDRNLEWDPKRNLLQGLNREQTPTGP